MPVSPLVLEVNAPREVFEGQPILVTASLVNRSQQPVVIVRPLRGNRSLGLSMSIDLLRGPNIVAVTNAGVNIYQSIDPWQYGKVAFQTLKPGEKVKIRDIEYRQEFSGPLPRKNDDWEKAPRASLKPGEYTIDIGYGFDRTGKARVMKDAQNLYQSAWEGYLAVKQSVTIRPQS